MSESKLASLSALAEGTPTRIEVDGQALAVIRVGDRVYAMDDRCSHADYSVSEGDFYEKELELECPQHGSAFSLLTGEPSTFPATKPVRVYPTRVDGDDVWVTL
jgi:3-phenylpropionate/trans-cinnamate dioxygenase ferredoxin subunit